MKALALKRTQSFDVLDEIDTLQTEISSILMQKTSLWLNWIRNAKLPVAIMTTFEEL